MELAKVGQERDFGGQQRGGQFVRTQVQDFEGLHFSDLRRERLELRSISVHTADLDERANVGGQLAAKRVVADFEQSQVGESTETRIMHDLQVGETDSIKKREGREVGELAEDGIIRKMQIGQLSERRERRRQLLERILVEMQSSDGDTSTQLRRHLDDAVTGQNDATKSATGSNRSGERLEAILGDEERLKVDEVAYLARKLLEHVIREIKLDELCAITKFLRELVKLV